ncbi:hypothetical protein BI036_gp155 [Morganella phage vB_MmoM_MP1]|uniref:Uncharacterized protein n=1 Tax=Morganella phage vB_MmoM_MP1 TaxID=1852628 RepID=A0A192YA21_9CAUD|nr:hypothetical protein BI036_gp155 [Morganella phage vB_MmoM_MP1]ANM46569.1 hypothetical protein MP1_gp0239 [Morganella phage vB_MmoM_MP1]
MIYIAKVRDMEESDTPIIGAWTSIDTMKEELLNSSKIAVYENGCYYLNPEYYYDLQISVQNGIEEEYVVTAVLEDASVDVVNSADLIYDALGITHLFKELP